MDVLHAFSRNSLALAYQTYRAVPAHTISTLSWHDHAGGLAKTGHAGAAVAFDNEGPRHKVNLTPFSLSSRLVTNGEWKAFMADHG